MYIYLWLMIVITWSMLGIWRNPGYYLEHAGYMEKPWLLPGACWVYGETRRRTIETLKHSNEKEIFL